MQGRAVTKVLESLICNLLKYRWTRRAAIRVVLRVGAPVARLLVAALESREVREIPAEVLVQIGTPAVNPLIAALESRNSNVRRTAVETLGNLGDIRAAEPLIGTLEDEDSGVRRATVGALGRIGDKRAVEPLIGTMRDKDSSMRGATAEALGKLGDNRAVEPLIVALEDRDGGVRCSTAEALGRLGDTRAVESLIKAFRTEDNAERICRIGQVLKGRFNSQPAVESLLRPRDKLILVAEDERDIRDLIGFTLRFAGFDVILAANGQEAIKLASKNLPTLISLDVRMPRMTGYEACRWLKDHPFTQDIPVIFLSGKSQEAEIERGLDVGGIEYICKPFAPDELVREINEILESIRRNPVRNLAEVESEIESLRGQIGQLRKQRADLRRRLSECEKQSTMASDGQLPLAELSRLTDGIVHDMRSGLGIIRNTTGFLEDIVDNSVRQTDLLKISRSLDFCELVLRNLSALGGQDIFQPKQVNLEAIAREVLFVLDRKLVDVASVIDADSDTPEILADEGQMKQIFMNLVKNAGEAMPDGGILTVRTRREGAMLRVEVSDTGYGMSPENQERLFQEFFTTKEQGYGLGLHIVNTIVKRHGGTIEVESKVDEGTTFTLRLPIKPE